MKEILLNPTEENIRKALFVLELPRKLKVEPRSFGKGRNVELECVQLFGMIPNISEFVCGHLEPGYTFLRMSQNSVSGYMVNDVLADMVSGDIGKHFFKNFNELARRYVISLEERVRLFDKVYSETENKLQPSDMQAYFLKQNFPVILLSENEDKIVLCDYHTQEFRSTTHLKLGIDINMIATDTHDHRLVIMKFLAESHLRNVQVVLFDDLKVSKKTKERPSEPYHHQGGVPTLRWLSAQQVPQASRCAQTEKPTSKDVPLAFPATKTDAVQQLLEDAGTYKQIKFS